jgi:hypothetical protein
VVINYYPTNNDNMSKHLSIDSFLIMLYIQYVGKRGRTFIVLTFYLCLDEYANYNSIYISFSEMKGSVESDIAFTI